jgi:hypothetical protein
MNPLAGKKAKVLYRNPDRSTVLQVEDEHDEILVLVAADGSMYEERIAGLAGVREALDAASPYDKVLVPNDAGRKVWTHLEPEPEPVVEPEPEPEPEAAPAPEARTLAIQVHQRLVKPRADYFTHGIPTADTEAWVSYATHVTFPVVQRAHADEVPGIYTIRRAGRRLGCANHGCDGCKGAPPELLGIHPNMPGTVLADVAKALASKVLGAGDPPPSGLQRGARSAVPPTHPVHLR